MIKKLLVLGLLGGGSYLVWRYMTVVDEDKYSNDTGFFPDVGGFIKTAAGMASGDYESNDMNYPNKNMQVSSSYLAKIKLMENGIKKGWDSDSKRWYVHDDGTGVPTIAYGHVVLKGESFSKGVSESEATGLLLLDIENRIDFIRDRVKVKLEQGQFDALLDFIYNAGEGSFLGTGSTAKKLGNNIPAAINSSGFDAGFAQIRKHYEYICGLPRNVKVAKGWMARFRNQWLMAYENSYW